MKLALYRNDYGHELSRVNKILKDKYGRPIGIAADNPILEKSMGSLHTMKIWEFYLEPS